MPFQDIFGGNTIYPSNPTYLALALSADVTLQWPIEQAITGDVVAAIIDVTPSGAGFAITMPDARLVATGYVSTFYNAGADDFDVLDAAGGAIMTVGSGEAWNVYLRSNTTLAGAWRIFQMGAGTSSANASTLAGAGLVAITNTLNEEMEVSSHAIDYVVLDADRARVLTWTGGAGNLTLPDPAVVGANWFCIVKNIGTGSVTIGTAAGTIDGSATLILAIEESAFLVSNGTNWMTVGFGQETSSVFDFISINVAGTGDYTLSGTELNRVSYELTGILTGNRVIIVPPTVQQYWINNATTGSFTLTVKTALGSGVVVAQGAHSILYCDATDVIEAQTINNLTFQDGSAAAPSVTFTSQQTLGLFRKATNQLGFATSAALAGYIDATGNLRWRAGLTTAVAYGFDTDPETGMWLGGVSSLRFSANQLEVLQLNDTAPQVILGTALANNIRINNTTQSTVGAAGGASALPATPLAYLTVNVNGSAVKIPYYNA